MPYIRLLGGLGNQLFQVAAGQVIQSDRGLPVVYDCSWYTNPAPGDSHRQLEVQDLLDGSRCRSFSRVVRKAAYSPRNPLLITERGPDDDLLSRPLRRHSFLHGYFQLAKHPIRVRRELLAMFEPKLALAPAGPVDAIAMHVRLGDYFHNKTTRDHHGLLSPSYYVEALRRLRGAGYGGQVVVFTDSPEVFAEEYRLALEGDVILADTTGAWETMSAMASYRAIVIANSSLSWWSAFIATQAQGGDTMIVRPQPWFGQPSAADENLALPTWQPLTRTSWQR